MALPFSETLGQAMSHTAGPSAERYQLNSYFRHLGAHSAGIIRVRFAEYYEALPVFLRENRTQTNDKETIYVA